MSGSALLQAARLWERISAKGTRYMSGRLGGLKVVILPNQDYLEGDQANGHTHTLFFQDGWLTQPRPATAERVPTERREPRPRQAPRGAPIDDDPVAF